MAQYTIGYSPAQDAGEQLMIIQHALEEYSETLRRMSKDVQEGLESEAQRMAQWSKTVDDRVESISRASSYMLIAVDAYKDAERLSFERLTEFTSVGAVGGIALALTPGQIMKIIKAYRLYRLWSNHVKVKPHWIKWPALINWRFFLPIYISPAFIGKLYLVKNRKWIIALLRSRRGKQGALGSAPEQSGGNTESGETLGLTTGSGVTALPEEDFTDAENAVEAQTGSAEGVVDVAPEETLETASAEAAEDPGIGSGGSGGYSGGASRYSGGGGSREATPATSDYTRPEDIPAFTEPDPGAGNNAGADTPVSSDYAQPDTSANSDFQGVSEAGYDIRAFVPGVAGPAGTPLKTGSGLSAPLIGVAAVSSVAASGLGLSNKLGGKQKTPGAEETAEIPVVSAKEAVGNFSGNLKGEYAVLGSALSILFSGASLKAGMSANNNRGNPDDRFKIGYGTSAILSGGAIQERS